ncbi:hypothetical protein N0V95_005789 [Ascochyta clinopodiicola]|nr:hypothetical protein N0V95_005789 [Ascochyta clinopodiicola]
MAASPEINFAAESRVSRMKPPRKDELLEKRRIESPAPSPAISEPSDEEEIFYPEGGLEAWLVVAGSFCGMLSCYEYYQFLIVFGIIGGVGTSMVVTPATTALGHFFNTTRGYATGIACTGGSVGGVVFPLMLEALFPKGWGWATRIQGFVFLVLLTLANVLIRVRLKPSANAKLFPLPNPRIFKQLDFLIVTVAAFFLEWGLFVPVTYLTSYCINSGAFTNTFAYQIIAIYNATSTVGRWVSGWLADKFGVYNVMIIMTFFCSSLSLGLWLPAAVLSDGNDSIAEDSSRAQSIYGLTITYAVLMGIASGSNISLAPVCVSKLCETRQYGEYYGMCYAVVGLGTLVSVPIAGAIIGSNQLYWAGALFCGLCYTLALLSFITIRVNRVGFRLTIKY